MRREGIVLELALFALAAALLLVGFGWPEPSVPPFVAGPRAAGDLRVVTWNVGGTEGRWGRALADEHVEHVAAVLGELDPDLALLQELRSERQADALLDALGPGWALELAPRHRGRRVAALARRGRLEPVELEGAPEGTLVVRLVTEEGRSLLAAGVHASATSSEERNETLGALAEALAGESGPLLLAGDLNLDLDLGKRQDLFTDDEYLDVETYNFVAARFRDAARGTGSTAEPDRRLDYLFTAPPSLRLRSAGPVRGRRTGDMDHDPVAADLRAP